MTLTYRDFAPSDPRGDVAHWAAMLVSHAVRAVAKELPIGQPFLTYPEEAGDYWASWTASFYSEVRPKKPAKPATFRPICRSVRTSRNRGTACQPLSYSKLR